MHIYKRIYIYIYIYILFTYIYIYINGCFKINNSFFCFKRNIHCQIWIIVYILRRRSFLFVICFVFFFIFYFYFWFVCLFVCLFVLFLFFPFVLFNLSLSHQNKYSAFLFPSWFFSEPQAWLFLFFFFLFSFSFFSFFANTECFFCGVASLICSCVSLDKDSKNERKGKACHN